MLYIIDLAYLVDLHASRLHSCHEAYEIGIVKIFEIS